MIDFLNWNLKIQKKQKQKIISFSTETIETLNHILGTE